MDLNPVFLGIPEATWGSRNKGMRASTEWIASILEDPKVQARLLSDARQPAERLQALLSHRFGEMCRVKDQVSRRQ